MCSVETCVDRIWQSCSMTSHALRIRFCSCLKGWFHSVGMDLVLLVSQMSGLWNEVWHLVLGESKSEPVSRL